ncbi:hypothetical protein AAFF_G00063850 [Aldrovandia affinis]|uniref:Uncharacterized protein n=1 Tax=Aldrovandia affinis TaxID=143900 RepID=A0AAD7WYF6_9TELE|nr:hypothetical protein AAFF_G00063850 [Aldrovandia affinis]
MKEQAGGAARGAPAQPTGEFNFVQVPPQPSVGPRRRTDGAPSCDARPLSVECQMNADNYAPVGTRGFSCCSREFPRPPARSAPVFRPAPLPNLQRGEEGMTMMNQRMAPLRYL